MEEGREISLRHHRPQQAQRIQQLHEVTAHTDSPPTHLSEIPLVRSAGEAHELVAAEDGALSLDAAAETRR
jgi:hypothetical protein